jgi:hypothetical protein
MFSTKLIIFYDCNFNKKLFFKNQEYTDFIFEKKKILYMRKVFVVHKKMVYLFYSSALTFLPKKTHREISAFLFDSIFEIKIHNKRHFIKKEIYCGYFNIKTGSLNLSIMKNQLSKASPNFSNRNLLGKKIVRNNLKKKKFINIKSIGNKKKKKSNNLKKTLFSFFFSSSKVSSIINEISYNFMDKNGFHNQLYKKLKTYKFVEKSQSAFKYKIFLIKRFSISSLKFFNKSLNFSRIFSFIVRRNLHNSIRLFFFSIGFFFLNKFYLSHNVFFKKFPKFTNIGLSIFDLILQKLKEKGQIVIIFISKYSKISITNSYKEKAHNDSISLKSVIKFSKNIKKITHHKFFFFEKEKIWGRNHFYSEIILDNFYDKYELLYGKKIKAKFLPLKRFYLCFCVFFLIKSKSDKFHSFNFQNFRTITFQFLIISNGSQEGLFLKSWNNILLDTSILKKNKFIKSNKRELDFCYKYKEKIYTYLEKKNFFLFNLKSLESII